MAATAMSRAARAGVFVGLSLEPRERAGPRPDDAEGIVLVPRAEGVLPSRAVHQQHPRASVRDRRPPAEPRRAGGLRRPARRRRIAHARVHRSALGRGRQPHRRRPAHSRPRRRQPRDAGDARRRASGAAWSRSTRRSWPRPTRAFVDQNRDVLGIDVAQLGAARATQRDGRPLAGQHPAGLRRACPVRYGRLAAIDQPRQPGGDRHRDLGQRGRRATSRPRVGADEALAAGLRVRGGPRRPRRDRCSAPALEIVPVAPRAVPGRRGASRGPVGTGYGHRLVWTFVFQRPPGARALGGDGGRARPARCSPSRTRTSTSTRQVTGGVYPLTNTEICPDARPSAAPCSPAGPCPSPTPASPRPTTSPTAPASTTTRAAPPPPR